ncbi:Protein arginine N-methyltransferase 9 like protein [Argiope bruennichi]|uniref:Protein arginine N-methyltransferase 9 like protein n=1 Tax=Argiope bruennichi TaxID=94029 RepID=A0A8T0FEC9_ARGBR|nr:Protein arginine N-methyltransferase 9 like protein [Argiope bruennichi]
MESTTEDWNQGRQLLLQRCKSRALSCLNEHEYSRAFAHFIVALTVEPSVKGELLNAFLFTLEKLSEKMEKEKQVNEVLMCYEQALDVLPHDSHVLHGLATTLFRLGYVECALSYFLKSYKANPFFTPSLYCMENLKNALVERWHFVMLNDKERNLAYKRAIKRAVENGHKRVLDIGAGTGILSMMAADANAEKVYACEASEIMFAVLQNVVKMNEKSIQVFPKFSTDLVIEEDLPEKVSLIVTEIFDAGLFGENSLETLDHAWEYLLEKDTEDLSPGEENDVSPTCPNHLDKSDVNVCRAKVIPYSADVYVVPVESEHFRKAFKLDNKVKQALDIKEDVIPQYLDEEPYSTEKISNIKFKYLCEPSCILKANFNSPQEIKVLLQGKNLNPSYKCTQSGNLDAFVMWFNLHLDDKETISTAPKEGSDSGCWEQAIFYVLPQYLDGVSLFCNVGDNIEAEFLCRGHFQLKKVKLPNSVPANNFNQKLTMDPSLINYLNSYGTGDIINLNLKDISHVDNASILDTSTFPCLSLKSLKDTSSVAAVLRTQYQSEIEQLRDMYGISHDRLSFKSYEDFCNSKLQCDFLIVDPVELCGLLKKNLLEDVTVLRMQCLKDSGLVVPGQIEIHAILVESETLKEHSKLISDERVDDYKISQIMNAYKIHQDIQFSALLHQKITEPFKLCTIDLNNTSENGTKSFFKDSFKTAEVEVATSAWVWYDIYLKRKQLADLLAKLQEVPFNIGETKINFLLLILCCMPIALSTVTTILIIETKSAYYSYGCKIENPFAVILLVGFKNFFNTVVFPTFENIIAMFYCLICLRLQTEIKHVTLKIQKCHYRSFSESKRIEILRHKSRINGALHCTEEIFARPSFLIVAANLLTCFSILSTYLDNDIWSSEILSVYAECILYSTNCLVPAIFILWIAGGIPIVESEFRETFQEKMCSRMLSTGSIGNLRLEKWFFAKQDNVLTGLGIFSYRRSSIFAVFGSLITYTVLFKD